MWQWILTQTAKFSFGKLLGGFNLLDGEKLGKIVFIVLIVLASMFVVNKWFTPRTVNNTAVTGQNVTVQQCDPKSLDKLIAEAKISGKNSSLVKLWFIRLF